MGSVGNNLDYNIHDIKVDGGILRYQILQNKPDTIYVHELKVSTDSRQAGIGTELLNRVKQIANRNNKNIQLDAYPVGKGAMSVEQLIKWYEKRGFEHQGVNIMVYKTKKGK